MPTLPDWLADPALRPLWEAAAVRLERRSLEPGGRVRLTGLDRDARKSLGDLLGRVIVADKVTVDLGEVDAMIRDRSGVGGLRTVVEIALGRRLRDRRAERTAAAAAREAPYVAARQWLDEHPGTAAQDWPEPWLSSLRRSGILTRIADPSAKVLQALEILAVQSRERRPCTREELSARFTGESDALEDDRPLGQLVLRGFAVAARTNPPNGAAARRTLWERYGVATDSVSSTCLTLRLRDDRPDPLHLSGWDLRRDPVSVSAGTTVLICESPRVLEALARLERPALPVVCTSGDPNRITLEVLRELAESGAHLIYHGDFDWAGVAVANRLVDVVGAKPWLMSAADYQAALRSDGPPLEGTAVEARWDTSLGSVMQANGVAVYEESVLENLLSGLAELVEG